MKVTDIRGEDALDVLADMIDPAVEIMQDEEIAEAAKADAPKLKIVKLALKKHKREVIELLAALEMQTPEEYAKGVNVLTLPFKVLEILNDPDVMSLFTSQAQTEESVTSGPVTANMAGEEK